MLTRRRLAAVAAMTAVTLAAGACGGGSGGSGDEPAGPGGLTVTSTAFADGAAIPERYSCEGSNASPPLSWTAPPEGTAELAIIVDDPDAPRGTFVHWVVVKIGADLRSLGEGKVPTGAVQVENDGGHDEYTGMCPPDGERHRYRFTVYALPRPLAAGDGTGTGDTVERVRSAAEASGTLEGLFGR